MPPVHEDVMWEGACVKNAFAEVDVSRWHRVTERGYRRHNRGRSLVQIGLNIQDDTFVSHFML